VRIPFFELCVKFKKTVKYGYLSTYVSAPLLSAADTGSQYYKKLLAKLTIMNKNFLNTFQLGYDTYVHHFFLDINTPIYIDIYLNN